MRRWGLPEKTEIEGQWMNHVEIKRRRIQTYSYALGAVTLLILSILTKATGVAYLAVSAECYFFATQIVSRSVADCLGRLLRGRLSKGQYKNAANMRRNAMLLEAALGAAAGVLLFACAKPLAEYVFSMPDSLLLIRMFAPAVFLRTISGVLQGYFQGDGSELPTAVTVVLRQVFVLGFAVLFCSILKDYGEKVSALLGREEFTYLYGAAGAAAAVILSEILVILFLLFIYKASSRPVKRPDEGMKTTESFLDMVKALYGSMGLYILAGLLERLPIWLGLVFFQKSHSDGGLGTESYGIFYGQYLAFCMVFISFISASMLPSMRRIMQCMKKEEQRPAKNCFQAGIHVAWAKTLFFTVFTASMSDQIAGILQHERQEALAQMLRFGSGIILFSVFALYFKGILFIWGRKYYVIGCLGISNMVFAVTAVLFLNVQGAGVVSLVYAGLFGSAIYCGGTGFLVFRRLGMGIRPVQIFLVPAGAAAGAGLLSFLLGRLLTPHLGETVCALLGFAASFLLYWGILSALRNFKEQELAAAQAGPVLKLIAKAFPRVNV